MFLVKQDRYSSIGSHGDHQEGQQHRNSGETVQSPGRMEQHQVRTNETKDNVHLQPGAHLPTPDPFAAAPGKEDFRAQPQEKTKNTSRNPVRCSNPRHAISCDDQVEKRYHNPVMSDIRSSSLMEDIRNLFSLVKPDDLFNTKLGMVCKP